MTYTALQSQAYSAEYALRDMFDRVAASEEPFLVTVAGSSVLLPLERKFGTIDSIQAYVDLVCHQVGEGDTAPRVRARQSVRRAHYDRAKREIAIPTNETQAAGKSGWAMREIVVLHELAHHFDRREPHHKESNGHGPTFVGTFLSLIRAFMGYEAWLLAISLFDGADVDIDFGV